MKRKPEEGYAVWVRYRIFNHKKEFVKWGWTCRTHRSARLDLEMAEALTRDLTRMGVGWEIRDKAGNVVQSAPTKNTA